MHLRDLFNRYRWSQDGNLDDLTVVIRHRGAPGDVRWIAGSEIAAIEPSFLVVKGGPRPEGGRTAHIPYHRILEVRDGPQLVFSRTRDAGDSDEE